MSNKHNYLIFFLCCSFFSPLLATDEHHPFIHPFMTFKFGQQWALDDNYDHRTPYSELFGLYSGLQFSSSLGWGIGYQYHDDTFASVTKVNLKTTLIESAFHYQWQLKDDWDIYGRLGLAYWNMKKSSHFSTYPSITGLSPIGELGLGYYLTPKIRLSLGYQYIDKIGKKTIGQYDSYALIFGTSYIFGQNNRSSALRNVPLESGYQEKVIVKTHPQIFISTSLGHGYSFSVNSTEIPPALYEKLSQLASILRSYPQAMVKISGHTDSTGNLAYNQSLSERRAYAVASQLEALGVSLKQVDIKGKGALKPIADNSTALGRAKNRRVEVIIPAFNYE